MRRVLKENKKREKREKKLIRAPDDLVERLEEVANLQGKIFYRYVTEIFEQAIRANDMRRNLKEIIDSYELNLVNREAGSILVPKEALDRLMEEEFASSGKVLQEIWYQTGRWYGVFLNDKFNDEIEAFSRLLEEGLWDMSEVSIKRKIEEVEVRCVSISISQERTLLIQSFIEGVMHSFGYETKMSDSFKGIITMKFQ